MLSAALPFRASTLHRIAITFLLVWLTIAASPEATAAQQKKKGTPAAVRPLPVEAVRAEALAAMEASGPVTGGRESLVEVTLARPAPSPDGVLLLLASSRPDVARVPPAMKVRAGTDRARGSVLTFPVHLPTTVDLSVRHPNGETRTVKLTVLPPRLVRLEVPEPVLGGTTVTGIAHFSGPPAAEGTVAATLSSDDASHAGVPASVALPPGRTAVEFPIITGPVSAVTWIRVRGAYPSPSSGGGGLMAAAASLWGPGEQETILKLRPAELDSVVVRGCAAPCTGKLRVVLEGPAGPGGGAPVMVRSSRPDLVVVPAHVTVPTGQKAAEVPAEMPVEVGENRAVDLVGSYRGVERRDQAIVWKRTLADLVIVETSLYDRYENPIDAPTDGQPFRLCARVSVKGPDLEYGDTPTEKPDPSTLRVSYRNGGGTGRDIDVPMDFTHGSNSSVYSTVKVFCTLLGGLQAGDAFRVTLHADAADVVEERKENNNVRQLTIARP